MIWLEPNGIPFPLSKSKPKGKQSFKWDPRCVLREKHILDSLSWLIKLFDFHHNLKHFFHTSSFRFTLRIFKSFPFVWLLLTNLSVLYFLQTQSKHNIPQYHRFQLSLYDLFDIRLHFIFLSFIFLNSDSNIKF